MPQETSTHHTALYTPHQAPGLKAPNLCKSNKLCCQITGRQSEYNIDNLCTTKHEIRECSQVNHTAPNTDTPSTNLHIPNEIFTLWTSETAVFAGRQGLADPLLWQKNYLANLLKVQPRATAAPGKRLRQDLTQTCRCSALSMTTALIAQTLQLRRAKKPQQDTQSKKPTPQSILKTMKKPRGDVVSVVVQRCNHGRNPLCITIPSTVVAPPKT